MRWLQRLVAPPSPARQPAWRAVVGVAAAGLLAGCLLLGLQLARLG